MRQTILWSKIYPVLTEAILKEFFWPEYWSALLNTQSFWYFFFKFWASLFNVVALACCVAPFFGCLSYWNTRTTLFTSPCLIEIIIIVKFLLKITTLKIQSDCFRIKRSQKRPTDCILQQDLHIYYHTWHWNVIKDTKFQPSLLDKKCSKCEYFWVPFSLYGIQDFILLAWGPHFEDFNIIVIQKIVNIHDLMLWVTEHFVMQRISETMKINVSVWTLRS